MCADPNPDDRVAVALADGAVLLIDTNRPDTVVTATTKFLPRMNADEHGFANRLTKILPLRAGERAGVRCISSADSLSGGVTQESIEAGPGLRIGQPALPGFVILTGEEEAGKIRQLGLFVWRQSFANLDDFRSGIAHDS